MRCKQCGFVGEQRLSAEAVAHRAVLFPESADEAPMRDVCGHCYAEFLARMMEDRPAAEEIRRRAMN